MKLEEIGFYTLEDSRAKGSSRHSPMWRCEVLLTHTCNFKCPYCNGMREDCKGVMDLEYAKQLIDYWTPLKNIRFSGGEPTTYPHLLEVVKYAKLRNVEHVAISTNGSASIDYYNKLIDAGVNDFSISLDACCSSFGKEMCGGIDGMWEKVVENIKEISKRTYVTLGMVFTDETLETVSDVVSFGSSLGVADIRIISSSHSNKMIPHLEKIPKEILERHPILNYRVTHFTEERNVRGIRDTDAHHCGIIVDDSAVAGKWHFPCIIYLREKGEPIGEVGPHMREERINWFKTHNSYEDPICRKNCLDVCIDYNNRFRDLNETFNEPSI